MPDTPKVIYIAADAEQAHLLANVLRDGGIGAHVTNDRLRPILGAVPFGLLTAPRVVVAESDFAEAQGIVLELLGEPPEAYRPFQFRMRTAFYVITALSVYLAVDRASGWRLVALIPLLLGCFEWILLLVAIHFVFRRKRIERG